MNGIGESQAEGRIVVTCAMLLPFPDICFYRTCCTMCTAITEFLHYAAQCECLSACSNLSRAIADITESEVNLA